MRARVHCTQMGGENFKPAACEPPAPLPSYLFFMILPFFSPVSLSKGANLARTCPPVCTGGAGWRWGRGQRQRGGAVLRNRPANFAPSSGRTRRISARHSARSQIKTLINGPRIKQIIKIIPQILANTSPLQKSTLQQIPSCLAKIFTHGLCVE